MKLLQPFVVQSVDVPMSLCEVGEYNGGFYKILRLTFIKLNLICNHLNLKLKQRTNMETNLRISQ